MFRIAVDLERCQGVSACSNRARQIDDGLQRPTLAGMLKHIPGKNTSKSIGNKVLGRAGER